LITIRPIGKSDWKGAWRIIEPVFRSGESYAFSPDISEEEAYKVWVEIPKVTYIALDPNSEVVGTYYIKPNQPELGAHVCNCGYIVAEKARGEGVATAMCEHSQREAVSLGFRAMQFNLVVTTNESAVKLWIKLGYDIIGTLPNSFRHPRFGYVDAHVMYKQLIR
jgi:RimJ/RimL family protein N-acetyltransferase